MPSKSDDKLTSADQSDLDKQLAEILPPDTKEEVTRLVSRYVSYSGPLPPASEFSKYEAVLAGSSNRILSMAEKSLSHVNKIEAVSLWGEISLSALGQILGAILLLALVGSGVYLVVAGHPIPGTFISVTGSIVGAIAHVAQGRSILFGTPNKTNADQDKDVSQEKQQKLDNTPRRGKR